MTQFVQEKNLDVAFAYQIHRSARLLRHHFIKTFKDHGIDLNPEQWGVLNKVWKNHHLNQMDLTDDFFKDKANITRILNSLMKKGLIIRERDENDRRAFRLRLSDQGIKNMEEYWTIALEVRKKVYHGLIIGDLENLKSILNKLEENLM
jgi:MarR family transcriptional regulator, transcriptional regulator for hemolysin